MANFFDQFDVVTPEQAGPRPQTRVTVGGPTSSTGGNFFDRFDEPALPDITAPGGIGAAFKQIDEGPQFSPADQRRMADLASAYREAPEGHGMAVDSRAQAMLKDVENNNPYNNATWQGLTFGFGDEIGAGIRTAFGQGDGYGENLAVERELLRRQRQERPLGMAGAEVVGAALPAFLLPGAGAARTGEAATTAATKAPGFIDRTADAIGAGATYGGLYGFGTGEGGFDSRLEEAGKGAAIGAAGAGVLSPVIEGVGAAGRAAWNAGKEYVAPFTQAGRERVAGTTLRDAASDPAAALDALQNPNQNVPIVPGSRPTTFQETSDMGLGGLERTMETRRPEPFMQRRADQNQARVSMLEGLQPEGSPEVVVSTLRQHLADIDRSTGEALEAATQSARNQTAALGGAGTPEGYGAAIRKQLDDVDQIRRQREGALWQAIDPDGTLALPADDIGGAARSIVQNKTRMSQPMEGNELGIFNDAATLQGVQPFREVADLRSRVSTAMRQELSQNGRTQVYARLAQLRSAIENNIENAVSARATQEAQAVASGAMREEDTIAAMLEKQRRETQEWYDRRAQAVSMGNSVAAGAGGNASSGPSRISPMVGGEGASQRGFGAASGNQGVQSPGGLTPTFDAEALARLRAANDFTKQTTPIYEAGPVGDVLARSGASGPFSLPVVAVPEKFFRRGSMGAEGMRALQAANNSPETAAAIRDYAIMSLRRVAERADGTLDPGRVEAWRRAHADALRAIPEIDRMLANPVQASEAVAQLTAARRQALDDYQSGIVRQLLGVNDPADVTRTVGAIFNSRSPVTTMRALVDQVRGNPDAAEGLRKAVADHIALRLRSNTEAATSGTTLLKSDQFQQFMRQNETALREVFSPGEVAAMKAIADDLQQANRSNAALKLPNRSNTAQDVMGQLQQSGAPQSILSRILHAGASIGAGTFAGGPWGGAAALLGTEVLGALRRAGLQKIDDILTEAMLNPDLARKLLEKAPPLAPAAAPTVPRAALPGAVMGVPAFKPEQPQRPLTSRERMTQALMSGKAPTSNLSPTQQRLVEALAR